MMEIFKGGRGMLPFLIGTNILAANQPSRAPVTFGGVLGKGLAGGFGQYQQYQQQQLENQRAAEEAAYRDQVLAMKLAEAKSLERKRTAQGALQSQIESGQLDLSNPTVRARLAFAGINPDNIQAQTKPKYINALKNGKWVRVLESEAVENEYPTLARGPGAANGPSVVVMGGDSGPKPDPLTGGAFFETQHDFGPLATGNKVGQNTAAKTAAEATTAVTDRTADAARIGALIDQVTEGNTGIRGAVARSGAAGVGMQIVPELTKGALSSIGAASTENAADIKTRAVMLVGNILPQVTGGDSRFTDYERRQAEIAARVNDPTADVNSIKAALRALQKLTLLDSLVQQTKSGNYLRLDVSSPQDKAQIVELVNKWRAMGLGPEDIKEILRIYNAGVSAAKGVRGQRYAD